jgi:hypothetical protein
MIVRTDLIEVTVVFVPWCRFFKGKAAFDEPGRSSL